MTAITIPGMRLVSGANAREHWARRSGRAKAQRSIARTLVANAVSRRPMRFVVDPIVVTITRLGVRRLDSDNLAISAKHVRDGIADALGIDDGDPRIDWRYAQERAKGYGVRIEIEPAQSAKGAA